MQVSLRDARANLAKLIELVNSGEEIELTKHGKTVARVVAPKSVTPSVGAPGIGPVSSKKVLAHAKYDTQAGLDLLREMNKKK